MTNKKDKFNPLVSIIIPVYNGENYVSEAIDSALAQTYNNVEIIVVNDGSEDRTDEICKSYGNKIKYIKKENGGVASALNCGIDAMNGEYFSWLSHDDLYMPDKVLKEIELLNDLNDKETIIGCNVDVVNSSKSLIKHNHIPDSAKRSVKGYLAFDQTTGLNGCSLLINKSLFKKYGYFNINLKVTQDYDMWYRLAKNVKFEFVDDALVLSRQHSEQGSKTMLKEVNLEVDKLHGNFIKNLTMDDLINYVDGDIQKYYDYYIQYKNMHCIKSASETALAYINLLFEKGNKEEALQFLNNEVFQNESKIIINNYLLKINTKKKKRILFYNNIWIRGGIERVLTKVFSFLKNDYEIYFVTFNFSENKGYELPKEINILQISEKLDYMLPSAIYVICKLLNIDVFIGNQNLNLNFLPVYKYLKGENIKTIACNHYNYFLPFQVDWLRSIAYYRNEYYSYADLVTWSTKICTYIYNCINKNGFYLPNPNTFEVESKIPKKIKNHIVTVARYDDAFKRLDLLLIAFSKIIKKVPDATLTVVGKCDFDMILPATNGKKLKELFEKLNIPEKNIKFVGEQKNLEKYYKEAECFLFTSETEGFGMVINEAAAFATPSIAFNISGLNDLIKNGENGFLVEINNVDELVEKAVNYLTDEKLKLKFMKNALSHVENFDLKNTQKKWNIMLNNLFENKESNISVDDNVVTIVREYEKTILAFPYYANYTPVVSTVKSSLYSKLKYYVKTYGIKATIIKIFKKIWRIK